MKCNEIHRTFPAAARDYFFVNVPRVLLAAVVVNALPFDRETSPRRRLSVCRQLLDNGGNALIIFPEGTRSPTGQMGEFKPGVGLLVAGSDYPVVPCYLAGTHRAWPKGGWLLLSPPNTSPRCRMASSCSTGPGCRRRR